MISSEPTGAQERFERILRARAHTEESAAAMPADMSGQIRDPRAGPRLRAVADAFRDTLTAAQLETLETWTDHYMHHVATSIAYGLRFPEGFA